MVDTVFPDQVVLLTQHYSITGGVYLRERRLSDFLNDRRDTNFLMRNASIARLEDPAKTLEKINLSVVPKAGILVAFEPPQKKGTTTRFIKYPKQKYAVFLALDGMEVRGNLNQPGPLDLRQAIVSLTESFLPITEAIVTLSSNPAFIIKREAVLINIQNIRFLGSLESQNIQEERKT
jgi:hypothetical protein